MTRSQTDSQQFKVGDKVQIPSKGTIKEVLGEFTESGLSGMAFCEVLVLTTNYKYQTVFLGFDRLYRFIDGKWIKNEQEIQKEYPLKVGEKVKINPSKGVITRDTGLGENFDINFEYPDGKVRNEMFHFKVLTHDTAQQQQQQQQGQGGQQQQQKSKRKQQKSKRKQQSTPQPKKPILPTVIFILLIFLVLIYLFLFGIY